MPDYSHYKVEDFLLDDSFLKWIAEGSIDESHWTTWPIAYPEVSEEFYQAIEIAKNLHIQPVRDLSEAEVTDLINRVLRETVPAQKRQKTWFMAAASLFIFISLGWLSYQFALKSDNAAESLTQTQAGKNLFKTEINKTSAPMLITLADSSSVILKPGSQLRFPKVFSKNKREVFLNGEAFFEVTKNTKKPFYIYSNEMVTRVLGTSFSIKAFKDDKEFKVIVNTGKVAVFANRGNKKLTSSVATRTEKEEILIPNQQVVLYRASEKLVKNNLPEPQTLSREIASVHFNFHETPLVKVIEALQQAYGITIKYDNKNLGACPLTASLTDQSLSEKLDLICSAVEAHYEVVNGEVIINGKGCSGVTNNNN